MTDRLGFFRRFPAFVLDMLIMIALVFPFGRLAIRFLEALGVHMSSIDTNAAALGVFLYYFWTIAIFYLLIEVLAGASPGKIVMKLKVAGENGDRASWGRRLGRYAGKVCCLLIIPPFGMTEVKVVVYPFLAAGTVFSLGTLLIFGSRKQTLYDRVSKTAVFKR
jgi:uncharacterized RDD family membrane protein YckC